MNSSSIPEYKGVITPNFQSTKLTKLAKFHTNTNTNTNTNNSIKVPVSFDSLKVPVSLCDNTDKVYYNHIINAMYYDDLKGVVIILDLKYYNALKSSQYKLYILKYVFSKYKSLKKLEDTKELFKIFIEFPSFLIDLLRQMISTNNNNCLDYILKHKNVSIDRNEYQKLQDYATNLRLFELINTITVYELFDVCGGGKTSSLLNLLKRVGY